MRATKHIDEALQAIRKAHAQATAEGWATDDLKAIWRTFEQLEELADREPTFEFGMSDDEAEQRVRY
jgi:hypothetical protein